MGLQRVGVTELNGIFHCVYVPYLFFHSSVDEHLGCFHVLVIISSVSKKKKKKKNRIHVCLSILVSSGYVPRSEIPGSYDGFIPNF